MARALFNDVYDRDTPFSAVLSDKGDGTGVVNITSAGVALTGSGATNTDPIVVNATSHGKNDGDIVAIFGVGGNTNANTVGIVANKTANDFELTDLEGADIAGNAAYTTGGVIYPAFCYRVPTDKVAIINRFSLFASDTANESVKYMAITALTNGIIMQVFRAGVALETLTPKAVTVLNDWSLWGGVETRASGVDADAESIAYAAGSPVSGSALVLDGTQGDVLVLRQRDDLSGLLTHRAAISGFLATP